MLASSNPPVDDESSYQFTESELERLAAYRATAGVDFYNDSDRHPVSEARSVSMR
jgi:hypothetical protein